MAYKEEIPTAWNAVGDEFKKFSRSETTECVPSSAMTAIEISVDRLDPPIDIEGLRLFCFGGRGCPEPGEVSKRCVYSTEKVLGLCVSPRNTNIKWIREHRQQING